MLAALLYLQPGDTLNDQASPVKLYLVDGTYELFRSYFGPPPASAPDGRPIGAVRGFVQSLLVLLRDESLTHVACAFDLAEEAASALGITVWPMIEFEADDGLEQVVICSPDKDLAQAVDGSRVVCRLGSPGIGRLLPCGGSQRICRCWRLYADRLPLHHC